MLDLVDGTVAERAAHPAALTLRAALPARDVQFAENVLHCLVTHAEHAPETRQAVLFDPVQAMQQVAVARDDPTVVAYFRHLQDTPVG